MTTRRSWFVYGTMLALWVLLLGWQAAEHLHVRRVARASLLHRAETISDTIGLIMRSQRLYVSRERLEPLLDDLVRDQDDVHSVQLFDVTGKQVASAGEPIEAPKSDDTNTVYWDGKSRTLTLVNPMNFTTNIILSSEELTNRFRPNSTNRPPPAQLPALSTTNSSNAAFASSETNTNETNEVGVRREGRRERFRREEFNALYQKRGTHSFIIVMSAETLDATIKHDLWLRGFIGLLATVAFVGCTLAWGNVTKTSELQIRLVRASEMNSHLKEMNLAAAGLAHETRNPLNIVRGLAQMISKQTDAPDETRIKAREIIDESDRVAAQLNEFINYSRPREVRRAATKLNSVIGEVVRALNYDIEEKKVQLVNLAEDLTIEADEQLLRQALFNLVINAVQAVSVNGKITVRAGKQTGSEAVIDIADNGPGVAAEHRKEIFKPYFTMHEEGTGLGLAVVQQITLAHGWEIECLPNSPNGAIFRITHVKLTQKN